MTWRIGGLFAGVGGLEIGLHAAGVGETAWFSEYDKDASAVLAARFPGVPNHGDVTAIDWHTVEPVDVLVGGYPCQPFSFAGQRGGADDARHLWPHFARALRVLRPRFAVLENVSGHLSLGFDAVLADLAEAGFDAVWTTLRASDVGAPHRRERLFVVAADADSRAVRSYQPGGMAGEAGASQGAGDQRQRVRTDTWDGSAASPDADGTDRRGQPGSGTPIVGARAAAPATDADDQGPQRTEPAGRRLLPVRGCDLTADTQRERLQGSDDPRGGQGLGTPGYGPARGNPAPAWGAYAAAIARWEHALGRAAPAPVDERGRLNAGFSEWMLGFPEGWVTDVLPRNPALRCIGNAVVPQVAAVVGRWLLEMAAQEADALTSLGARA